MKWPNNSFSSIKHHYFTSSTNRIFVTKKKSVPSSIHPFSPFPITTPATVTTRLLPFSISASSQSSQIIYSIRHFSTTPAKNPPTEASVRDKLQKSLDCVQLVTIYNNNNNISLLLELIFNIMYKHRKLLTHQVDVERFFESVSQVQSLKVYQSLSNID